MKSSCAVTAVRVLGPALAACVLGIATAASAQGLSTTVYAPGDGSPNSLTIEIPVTASVGGRCGFATDGAPTGDFDAGQIDLASWTHDFEFELECTGPSRVAVISSNGGLLTDVVTSDPGYVTLAPYTVALNLVGSTTTASDSCLVETLTTGASSPCDFLGPASQTQGLRLDSPSLNLPGTYVRVSAPAYEGPGVLVEGSYQDTLTITVAAAP